MEKRSAQIEILGISRDGKWKKTYELAHEEEIIVRLNGEIQKFYCIPFDLEEMIAGNLKSRGIDPSLSQIKKLSSSEFEVNFSEELVKTHQKCDSKKKSTKSEVFDTVKNFNENSFLYEKTGCAHVVGICGDKAIFCQIPIVISISASTYLAVKEANKYGITLIGFASSKGFDIYSHDWRIET